MKIKVVVLFSLICVLFAACQDGRQNTLPLYQNPEADIEDRIEDALKRMTLEEKVAICHAQSKFSSPGVPRLGIPEIWCDDGPHGVRAEVYWDMWNQAGWTSDSCTAFPALTALAASWNPKMSALYGKSLGEEFRYRKKDILLGPGLNIYRTPLNGRNFEYMGEDPYLASRMVIPYVQGVQENGVAACVKHFALNNQEKWRHENNVNVSDRALHEIYLPAFKAAVCEAGAWAIMGAYGSYKNQHCCHNSYLLQQLLRDEWHFDGAVISDWGGTHDTREAALNGLDMEFGTWTDGMREGDSSGYKEYYLADAYLKMLREGQLPIETVDAKVRNILRLMYRTTMMADRPWGSFNSPEHSAAARKILGEGIVLLKNQDNLLPLSDTVKKILVVGENAIKRMTIGGGSSSLKARYEVSPLKGIEARFGKNAEVKYCPGYASDMPAYDDPMGRVESANPLGLSTETMREEAVAAAAQADVVLLFGGLNKHLNQDSEGDDRLSYDLPYYQDELVEALLKVNPNLVFVLISGNGVAMPWIEKVPTVLQAWFGGAEAGNAIADIISGDVNPSGKLPYTMPVRLEDNGAHALGEYPGDGKNISYNEDIYVGYRWADKMKSEPLFCFGHGLSYTTFQYSQAEVSKSTIAQGDGVDIKLSITNTGKIAGAEVVQCYLADLVCSLPRPEKELKAFEKVFLQPGESREICLHLEPQAMQFYNPEKGGWIAESGEFEAFVGGSSRDIRTSVVFALE